MRSIFPILLFFLVLHAADLIAQKRDSFTLLYEKDSCRMVDPLKKVIVGDIRLRGNNVTRDRIIFREMELNSGDTLNMYTFCRLAMQSRANLLNRGLFNFVTVDTLMNNGNHPIIDLEYSFIERWYVWPLPIFELADRNFNSWLESRDWSRVNYGVFITHNNFRGRMEKLKLLLRAGYNQNYTLRYDIPYLTHRQDLGLGIWMGHSRSRELPYAISNDKLVFFKDENSYSRNEYYANLLLTYRKGYRNIHTFMFGYENQNYADTLLLLNPDFAIGPLPRTSHFNLYYQFKHDRRDYLPYPLSGHYFDIELMKRGLGFPDKQPDFHYVKTTFDIYRPIANRWFWASSVTAKLSGGGRQPFHLRRGLGYGNDFVRSYELYVIDGEDFGLTKNNLKFAVLPPRIANLNFIPTERFSKIHYAIYANLFFDAGYVKSSNPWPDSRMQNKLIYGTGIGIDFVTYYDMVFRLEYGINMFNETGFFIHFVAPI
jgi:outer membrane protein assembly factor BamA